LPDYCGLKSENVPTARALLWPSVCNKMEILMKIVMISLPVLCHSNKTFKQIWKQLIILYSVIYILYTSISFCWNFCPNIFNKFFNRSYCLICRTLLTRENFQIQLLAADVVKHVIVSFSDFLDSQRMSYKGM
jgi:hypothetical protein